MSTGKLKISHVRGSTAVKVCAKVSQVMKDAMTAFYKEHVPGLITGGEDARLLPWIIMSNQSDLTSFLQPWRDGKEIIGRVYSSTPVEQFPQQKFNDFILLFNDTVRVDFECTVEKYDYPYVPLAVSWVLVKAHAVCLDRQKFLDSLDIELELEIPKYVDILGNPVSIGDIVCVSCRDAARLYIDKVKNLTPYSIVLENGRCITHKTGYDNELVVVTDFTVSI